MTTRPQPQVRPRRGEVWWANLDPTIGAEISKLRTVVVISSDAARKLPIKLVAPITGWQSKFVSSFWHVRLTPTSTNGLTKESAADTLQLRGLDTQRFQSRVGQLSADSMEEISAAIAALIEYS